MRKNETKHNTTKQDGKERGESDKTKVIGRQHDDEHKRTRQNEKEQDDTAKTGTY